ncbi:MAG: type II toxin-antitoxin system VapC family toxin [Cupriavidus sp.]|nr:type II toxin-antitoxin system VapC family toxin [Cupriavidus sp.]NUT13340.1 type II toxin-antitoxin system VapC family toxin [Cupriavidus sp.]
MIVLDTHALLWWTAGSAELSDAARTAIARELAEGDIVVSAISAWEVAMLVERGRLVLTMDVDAWLATVAEIDVVRILPVDASIAVKSVNLPGDFHKDPADRMIVTTARMLAAPLVTRDEKIRAYPHVRTIW